MSNVNPVNASSALANTLTTLGTQTEEEKLFQEAVQNVTAKKQKSGSVSTFLRDLNSAQTVEDVSKAFEKEREANVIWRESSNHKWRKKAADLATKVMYYKDFVEALTKINSNVGDPIWGAIKFILGVIQDLSKTDDLLNLAKERLEATMERFADHWKPGDIVQGSLRSALRKYYEHVVGFVVDLQSKFAQSFAISAVDVLNKAVKDVVDPFLKKLDAITHDVDASASSKRFDRSDNLTLEALGKINHLQAQMASASNANIKGPSGTKRCAFGIPDLLSKSFTGQGQYLAKIWLSLNNQGSGQTQAAVHGLGGIGKTQILLKYAKDHHPRSNHPRAYHTIIWINAASTADIDQTVRSFLRENAVQSGNYQYQDHTTNFRAWLRDAENWLLILDNVDQRATINDILPDGDHGHILCSTRHELVASQLSRDTAPIEISTMEDDDAARLVQSLAQYSELEQDKTELVAREVVRFAQGLPLMIEQIVHDAIFSRRSIENTLISIRNNERLLNQQNFSSLHGTDSSIGAVVWHSKQILQERSPQAAALFELLVYFQTSSISTQMIVSGAKKLPEYVNRIYTFDRGHVERSTKSLFWSHERIDAPAGHSGSKHKNGQEAPKRKGLRDVLRFRREPSKSPQRDLPMDSTKHDILLRNTCRDDTPTGQLFRDKVNIEDAIRLLKDLALIRQIDNDQLWIHDVYTEVTRALIEGAGAANAQQAAVTSAALVYLAFPLPTKMDSYRRLQNCWDYLPHAMTCHKHLLSLGILNDLSLGAELSHIIGSTISQRSNLHEPLLDADVSEEKRRLVYARRERERNNEIIRYYKYALAGYLASARRVDAMDGVTEAHVITSIRADEERELSHGFEHSHYYMDCQRFGRSSHWRVLQTSFRLSQYYEDNSGEELMEASAHTRLCLHLHERIFGIGHEYLLFIRSMLYTQLTAAGKHEDAYQVAIQGIRNFYLWNETHKMELGADEHGDLSYSRAGTVYCENAGKSCLELPDRLHEAPLFFYVWLRRAEMTNGKEHFTCRQPMQALATAYEKLDERSTSIYWWGRSVLCVLGVLEWEPMISDPDYGYDPGPWIGAFLNCEETMQETVRDFEQARVRLGQFQERSLLKFLDTVELRISIWKGDREKHGSPYERSEVEEYTGELPEWVKARLANCQ